MGRVRGGLGWAGLKGGERRKRKGKRGKEKEERRNDVGMPEKRLFPCIYRFLLALILSPRTSPFSFLLALLFYALKVSLDIGQCALRQHFPVFEDDNPIGAAQHRLTVADDQTRGAIGRLWGENSFPEGLLGDDIKGAG